MMKGKDFIAWTIIIVSAVLLFKSCVGGTRQPGRTISDEYRQQLLEEDRKEAIRRGGGSWRRNNL
jgi:hypothetical protein